MLFPTTAHDTICTAPGNFYWGKFGEKKQNKTKKDPRFKGTRSDKGAEIFTPLFQEAGSLFLRRFLF